MAHTYFQRPQERSLPREMCGHCSWCFHFPHPSHRRRPITIISLFPCICIIHTYFFLCEEQTCRCMCVCTWRPETDGVKSSLQLPFHLLHQIRVSQTHPELDSVARLASQLALMIPSLPSKAGITGWQPCSSAIYIGLWGPGLGSLYLHFNHCAISLA